MNENKNGTKILIVVLVALVAVLLAVVAFLLGKSAGEKNNPAETPVTNAPVTETGELPTQPIPTVPAVPGETPAAPATTLPVAPVIAGVPQNLDIDVSAGNLTFTEGDAFNVDYDDGVIVVRESGDTLLIENKYDHPTASQRRRMDVTVTVPVGYVFNDVDVELGAGKLIVHTLRAEGLEMELGAGSASIDDIHISGSASIREGAGELNVKSGEIHNLDLQCGAGATRVSAAVTGTSRVVAAVGAVDLNFTGDKASYTVAFRMGLGACYYDGEKIARSGEYGAGPNRIDINGGLGVMRVNVG